MTSSFSDGAFFILGGYVMSNTKLPILETERLILRAVSVGDVDDMFEYASTEEVTQYTTFKRHRTKEDTCLAIQEVFLKRPVKGWPEAFAIVLKESNKMIGTCDFWPIAKNDVFEMGYALNPKHWNQGIVTEAGERVLKYAFEEYGVRRMELRHIDQNIGSKKVGQKLGFIHEGTKRKFIKVKSEYRDLEYYGMLKEEYNERTR